MQVITHQARTRPKRLHRHTPLQKTRTKGIAFFIGRELSVGVPQPRRIEDADVAELSLEITEHLRGEIRRHGQH